MLKTLLLLVAGLVAGLAIAFFLQPEPPQAFEAPARFDAPSAAGAVQSDRRIQALEVALQAEIAERQALEDRVAELDAALAELARPATGPRNGAEIAGGGGPAPPSSGAPPGGVPRRGQPRGPLSPEQEVERLVAGGFSPDRAAWIQRRSAELTLQAMQAQYEARRQGQPVPPGAGLQTTLRAELGDAEYERYLTALGRPTSVGVFNVLPGSAGERAGLRAGDEIVSYAGKRVFDIRDLNDLTLQGSAGESVVIDVVRDGQPLQLVVPRGPIGFGGGPFRR